MDSKVNIFTVYTSKDEATMLQLLCHLKPLKKEFKVDIWHDDPIKSGETWKPQLSSRLDQADIFLFLVSNTFMHSEFVKQLEFKTIIDKYKAGNIKVIPVILDDCPWDVNFEADEYTFNFKELYVLPGRKKTIADWKNKDITFEKVTAHVKKIVASNAGIVVEDESAKAMDNEAAYATVEDQIAMTFSETEDKEKRKSENEKKVKDEIEAKRKEAEKKRLDEEAKANKAKADEQRRMAKLEELKRAADQKRLRQTETSEIHKEEHFLKNEKNKKVIFWGAIATAAAIVGIIAFSMFNGESGSEPMSLPEKEVIAEEDSALDKDSSTSTKPKTKSLNAAASLKKLEIGSRFESGFIFEIDGNGKSGKIAHIDDAGPMTWNEAMAIHEEFGEGWRVPTFEELKQMYKTVGQGANNVGEFADELYWSATPYDANQAKLVRFRDGNTTYHYNSRGTHRRYRVRAIRDFSR